MAQFVDWDLAVATAQALGKAGPNASYEEAATAVADLRELAGQATDHVSTFTGLRVHSAAPPVRVVDRRDWAKINIEGLREVIGPLLERLSGGKTPGPLATAIGSRFTGVQAGTVLAYLSGKVLGQYEVFSSDPGQLLLVAPNIVDAERKLETDPRDFRLWVCLHEVTHRVQFTAVPWMRAHFLGEVGAFVDASQLDQDQMFDRIRRGVTALAEAVRDPDSRTSVLDLVQTPGQRAVLDRITALMTLLEGHAEYVMDGVGPEVVPSVEEIRSKFTRRRETANPLDRVLRKLLGVDVKLRQYAEGRKFVHSVVERVGMEGFNKIWQSPLSLPRLAELSDPDAWVNRVHGAGAGYRRLVETAAPVAVVEPPVVVPPAAPVAPVGPVGPVSEVEPAAAEPSMATEVEPAAPEASVATEPVAPIAPVGGEPPTAPEPPTPPLPPEATEPPVPASPAEAAEPPAPPIAAEPPVVPEPAVVAEPPAPPVVVDQPPAVDVAEPTPPVADSASTVVDAPAAAETVVDAPAAATAKPVVAVDDVPEPPAVDAPEPPAPVAEAASDTDSTSMVDQPPAQRADEERSDPA
jgi:coenzyme F420 biosynthesis associated uncharacterized protein